MKKQSILFVVFLIVFAFGLMYVTKLLNNSAADEFENSVPVQFALKKAKSNSEIVSLLGAEITLKPHSEKNKKKTRISFSFGSDKTEFEQQNIDSELLLKGEKGEAILKIVGHKENDEWIYEELSIKVSDSEEIIHLVPRKSKNPNPSN
jgi:hypothetical protein